MSNNPVLDNLRQQWLNYNQPSKPTLVKQQQIPTKIVIKSQFEHTCPQCSKLIIHDTLFVNDFTGRYIALDKETMKPHHCKLSVINDTTPGKTSQ